MTTFGNTYYMMPYNSGYAGASSIGMGGYQSPQYMQPSGMQGQMGMQTMPYNGTNAYTSCWQLPQQSGNSGGNSGNQMMGMMYQTMNMMMSMLQQMMGMFQGGGAQQGQQPGGGMMPGGSQFPIGGGMNMGSYPGNFNNISFDGTNNGGSNMGIINNGFGSMSGISYPGNGNVMMNNNPWGGQNGGQWMNNGGGFNNISFDGTNNGGSNQGMINNWGGGYGNGQNNIQWNNGNGTSSISFDGTNNGGVNIGIINNYGGSGQECDNSPPPPEYCGGTHASFSGDPHLKGFDGESYDVMGQSGKYYDMLSDQNVQYNTKFESWGKNGANVVTQAGIQVGNDKVYYDRTMASPTVNGVAMQIPTGQTSVTQALDDGGSAMWNGTDLTVNTQEYVINLEKVKNATNGDYLNSTIDIKNGGPYQDLVAPTGLLGQTADNIPGQKNTGVNQGNQGGTVITGTVGDYQVNNIWGTNDKNNRFGDQVAQTTTDNSGNVVQTVDKDGTILYKKPQQTTSA